METAVVISLVCGFFAWLYISDKNETAEREARARQAVEEADRKKREREAWLRTPEGLAWQQSELEKAQRQTEEKERLQARGLYRD